ncbi:hypothetical protein BJX63DRAFT_431510 [Aspergillus granulosus]|uniref:Uncharacterized protein n=1 Tax=Aspergillus granulosus TaxID=176169 RepID=A0ABR4HH65_9EURO
MIHYIILLAAAFIGSLPSGVLARECRTNESTPEGYFPRMSLTSPDELAQFDGCETLTGYFYITSEFTGTLSLPTVTNFSGYITLEGPPTYGLEAVNLPNVQYMETISLRNAWGLKTLRAPRLETLKELILTQAEKGSVFDLPELKEAEFISLAGFWSSISFPSLERNMGTWVYTDPSREATDTLVPVDIDFPVLKESAGLYLYGQIKSLSTPLLEVLGDPQGRPRGLQMEANYTAMEGVFLPALRELHGQFAIHGHVSAVNLGDLKSTSAPITIQAESPIEVYSKLENAGKISIQGELAVLNFMNLTTATDMDIVSERTVSCPEPLIDIYRYFSKPDEPDFCSNESIAAAGENPYLDPHYQPSVPVTGTSTAPTFTSGSGSTPTPWLTPSSTPSPVYSPTPTPGSGGGKLSSAAEAAIVAVGVLIGCFAIGGWIVMRWKRKHVKREANMSSGHAGIAPVPPAVTTEGISNRHVDDSEPLPRHSADIAPPPYSREEPGKV